MNGRKGNLYRAWAGDTRVWSQVREVAPIICEGCHNEIDTRMELVTDGKCEECVRKEQAHE